jgi:hypothetical protein
MAEDQRNARIFGVLFLITFITSIPALLLYQPASTTPRVSSPLTPTSIRSTWAPSWSCS